MDFWRSAGGWVEVTLTSASLEASLAEISRAGIELRNVQNKDDLTCSFSLSRRNIRTLTAICSKRGDRLQISKRFGVYWTAKRILSRPVLLLGFLLLLILILWLPTRVLFVQVEGNDEIPTGKILEAAETCGIRFGASRREVRSEKMKNALLEQVPQLQWAGVNTSGCTARISVREKNSSEEQQESETVASIVAARDGYVLSVTATAGNLLVQPGDTVRKGQVLISAYTDCGFCIRAERAEGEILGQTSRTMDAVMPSSIVRKGNQTRVKRKFSLLVRKKRIFLWKDSGIWEGSCDRMYEEYYITLPGGFQLPVALCVDTYMDRETCAEDISVDHANTVLPEFAKCYLNKQMVAGKILSGVHTLESEDGLFRLNGEYTCAEMIGTVRQEEIGETNGENS